MAGMTTGRRMIAGRRRAAWVSIGLALGWAGELVACSSEMSGHGNGGETNRPSSEATASELPASAAAESGPMQTSAPALRRLNHEEYNNTVRDLLGTQLHPADAFLADNPGGGFDTVGAAASLPPDYVRDYEKGAYDLIADLYGDPERLRRVVSCDIEAGAMDCAREVVAAFARRAWRRPVAEDEVEALLEPIRLAEQQGAALSLGLRYSLAAVLMSPHFLFKIEFDPDPISTVPHRLNDHELATRLSYALWSTMPDEELSRAADAGRLQSDTEFAAQFERLLSDPRASALSRDFAGQWLEFRELDAHEVESRAFPEFDRQTLSSMQREAELFFGDFLASDRDLRELFTARFTFVDQRLAEHYGLPAQPGTAPDEFVRVDTSAVPRTGVLTLGALLTTTSLSSRTSPVKRGEFVLRRLLCSEVPPPPPTVTGLDANEQSVMQTNLTLRQRMEEHRSNPACQGCHTLMDPIGFGLENYDAIGQYRTEDSGLPLDASGELPSGSIFSGALELAALLADDARFSECVVKSFMTFAVGRLFDQPKDSLWIHEVTEGAARSGGGLKSAVREVLLSELFRSRQALLEQPPLEQPPLEQPSL